MALIEAYIQRRGSEKLRDLGCLVVKMRGEQQNGMPDLLVIPMDSPMYFVEVKTVTGELTRIQEFVHKKLVAQGVAVYVARSIQEIEDTFYAVGRS